MHQLKPVDNSMQASSAVSLVIFYDDYHTPLDRLRAVLGNILPIRISMGEGFAAEGSLIEVVDKREWFADEFVARAIRASARYQQLYNLSAALARPALAEAAAELACDRGCRVVVHGFAGNDRLRFETALAVVQPDIEIVAVASLIGSRTHANADGFTRSENLWGETLEAGPLGDPGFDSSGVTHRQGREAEQVGREVTINFCEGLPIGLDGTDMTLASLIERLTALGVAAGVPWHDLVEDGNVGLKSRALYLNPASDIIAAAHDDLARFTGSRRESRFREIARGFWADLVYDGGWFDPLRESLDAYFLAADRHVTGSVKVALHGGRVRVVARTSPASLYDEAQAIYRAGEDFGEALIEGLRDQAAQIGRLARARGGQLS